ncbi:hypothetical protein [Microbacterium sp. SL75]|uniref:hypothetical protein n=1 Tax=Microbacterium sp. SL75 TaxID=2995140 RepID=UPI002270206B|nr:hypothetical protein [Microbacterium sp. SL75]WAC70165.1 hypothetical protein OVA17_05585 [Microbacterium sp. SL75]
MEPTTPAAPRIQLDLIPDAVQQTTLKTCDDRMHDERELVNEPPNAESVMSIFTPPR